MGVVKDARYGTDDPGGPVQPFFFLPVAQADYTQANLGSLFLHGMIVLCGLIVGLPLAFAVGRFLGSQLYGLNPLDPWVTCAAIAALGVSALAAASIPALRATRVSPLEALRFE